MNFYFYDFVFVCDYNNSYILLLLNNALGLFVRMKYEVRYSREAKKDYLSIRKSGNRPLIKKVDKILDELSFHPTEGTGKPEKLKGDLAGYYSRRLNKKHRIIYTIDSGQVIVYVLAMIGHYSDK